MKVENSIKITEAQAKVMYSFKSSAFRVKAKELDVAQALTELAREVHLLSGLVSELRQENYDLYKRAFVSENNVVNTLIEAIKSK